MSIPSAWLWCSRDFSLCNPYVETTVTKIVNASCEVDHQLSPRRPSYPTSDYPTRPGLTWPSTLANTETRPSRFEIAKYTVCPTINTKGLRTVHLVTLPTGSAHLTTCAGPSPVRSCNLEIMFPLWKRWLLVAKEWQGESVWSSL